MRIQKKKITPHRSHSKKELRTVVLIIFLSSFGNLQVAKESYSQVAYLSLRLLDFILHFKEWKCYQHVKRLPNFKNDLLSHPHKTQNLLTFSWRHLASHCTSNILSAISLCALRRTVISYNFSGSLRSSLLQEDAFSGRSSSCKDLQLVQTTSLMFNAYKENFYSYAPLFSSVLATHI